MLHASRRPEQRAWQRGIGLLLVAAFVLLLVAGMAHALDTGHGAADAHDCGVCVALAALSTALPLFLVVLLFRAAFVRTPAPARAAFVWRRRSSGPPPVRGPPVRS